MKDERCSADGSLFGSNCSWIFILIAIVIIFFCFCDNKKEDKKLGCQDYMF